VSDQLSLEPALRVQPQVGKVLHAHPLQAGDDLTVVAVRHGFDDDLSVDELQPDGLRRPALQLLEIFDGHLRLLPLPDCHGFHRLGGRPFAMRSRLSRY